MSVMSNTFQTRPAVESAERGNFFDGGAERFQFVTRVFPMLGFRLVAGEFHPQFRRNAFIGQRACEAVPQGVEYKMFRLGQ